MNTTYCARLIQQSIQSGKIFSLPRENVLFNLPRSLYAMKTYKQNDVIHSMNGFLFSSRAQDSIYIGNGMYILDRECEHLKSSPTPNVRIQHNKLVAAKDIAIHEELTYEPIVD